MQHRVDVTPAALGGPPTRRLGSALLLARHADAVLAGLDFESAQQDPDLPEINSSPQILIQLGRFNKQVGAPGQRGGPPCLQRPALRGEGTSAQSLSSPSVAAPCRVQLLRTLAERAEDAAASSARAKAAVKQAGGSTSKVADDVDLARLLGGGAAGSASPGGEGVDASPMGAERSAGRPLGATAARRVVGASA